MWRMLLYLGVAAVVVQPCWHRRLARGRRMVLRVGMKSKSEFPATRLRVCQFKVPCQRLP